MSSVEPTRQINWDWRAAGNFIGGGSGSGLMVLSLAAWTTELPYWPVVLLAMVLTGIGLFCVWAEIGRPWRAINVYFHPQTSWMTRESIIALPFFALGAFAVANAWWQLAPPWLEGAIALGAAVTGAVYLYCQARILFGSKGIPAWRHEALKPVIGFSGLVEGAGLLAVAGAAAGANVMWLAFALLALLALRAASWRQYLAKLAAEGAPVGALKALERVRAALFWGGHVLPALLALAALVLGGGWLLGLAGLIAALGGWVLKYVVIVQASYNQGFALPNLPVRGRGTPAPGTKPGWRPSKSN